MKTNNIINAVKSTATTVGMFLKKNSPTILAGIGTAGVIAGTVIACKKTLELTDILDEMKDDLDVIHEVENTPELAEKYTAEENQKAVVAIYMRAAGKIIKLYAVPASMILLSLVCLLGSNRILANRGAEALAIAAATKKEFDEYRKNAIEKYGELADKELRYGVNASEVSETDDSEKTIITDKKPKLPGRYSRCFDESSRYWMKDADKNKDFLVRTQQYVNDQMLWQYKGAVVTLNDVLDALDLPRMAVGQSVGWVNSGKLDANGNHIDKIDFGIFDISSPASREFVNGLERNIFLDFNVQGDIMDTFKF